MKGKPKSRRAKSAAVKPVGSLEAAQSEWRFAELDCMGVMPRCEQTGANVDLHLVAFRDPETDESTAAILGADYRHLVRRSTSLSVPLSILNLAALKQLESQRKIPLGTRAAKRLRAWFRHELEGVWKEGLRPVPREPGQASLELGPDLSAEEEEPFQLKA